MRGTLGEGKGKAMSAVSALVLNSTLFPLSFLFHLPRTHTHPHNVYIIYAQYTHCL